MQASNLKKYFRKGFTILDNDFPDYILQKRFRNVTVLKNNYNIWDNVSVELLSLDRASSLFTDNNHIRFDLHDIHGLRANLYGHLTGYEELTELGNFSVTFVLFDGTFAFNDPSAPNQFTFAFGLENSTCHGSIIYFTQGARVNFTVLASEY